MFVPVFASLLLVSLRGIGPRLQQTRLDRSGNASEHPPVLQIDSTDRNQLLAWSAAKLESSSTFPADLSNVEFRGVALVTKADHKAVLLKMKNEQRASLLIVDARLTQQNGVQSMHETSGSASLWSDRSWTYVLLFNGSDREMLAYMAKMGIDT